MEDTIRRASIMIALEELRHHLENNPNEASPSIRQPNREGGEDGAKYIHRLLTENPMSCKEQLRLDRDQFIQLVNLMIARNLLQDGKYIKVSEQVGIALYILAKGNSYRDASDTFKHSKSSICKYFNLVLDALVLLSFDIIRPHRDLLEIQPEVQQGTKYWPYLKDAIGALDGTPIDATISDEKGVPFCNRKGNKSWNVLACCSLDIIYTYINVGWEGSAHDVTVWKDSLTNSKFCFPHPPPGKYYLVDSGYPNTLGYLAPIANTRKHMPDFRKRPPTGKDEHFNHLHSSLRMKVECSFGQMKKRWRILNNMPQSKENVQKAIIVACFTLHNFIRMQQLGIPIVEHNDENEGVADINLTNATRKNQMAQVRNHIAQKLWNDILTQGNTEDEENEETNDDEETRAMDED